MKSKFNSNLYKNKIDKKHMKNISGGDWATSGGTESGNTHCGQTACDTYTTIYADDCREFSFWVEHCE